MKTIAILASGSGTNAENIIKYFSQSKEIKVDSVLTNKKNAGVIERANRLNIPHFFFSNVDFKDGNKVETLLSQRKIDYIILAGFLALIPENLTKKYPKRIINIHPALLPKYGGKGMYGDFVHKAVIENQEKESGISIHFVNEKYDEGEIILQAHCPVYDNDSVQSLANRIHKLEYRYFPTCIEQVILDD